MEDFFKKAGGAFKSFTEGLKGVFDIHPEQVIKVLEECKIRKPQYTTEKAVEAIIAKFLNDYYGGHTHQQYAIGGYTGLKVDIDLYNGKLGIELKLACNLDTIGIERLFGQLIYYQRRIYKQSLIAIIVGSKKEYTPKVKEVEDFIKDLGIYFYYMEVK